LQQFIQTYKFPPASASRNTARQPVQKANGAKAGPALAIIAN